MLTRIIRAAGLWACLLPGWALGQTTMPAAEGAKPSVAASASPSLVGRWQGPLPIPGGSVPLEISIVQPGANKLVATLDLPAKRLSRVPASLTFRGDTLIFYAVTVECRFVCVQSPDGRRGHGCPYPIRAPRREMARDHPECSRSRPVWFCQAGWSGSLLRCGR